MQAENSPAPRTLSREAPLRDGGLDGTPVLIVVMLCDDPLAGSSRHSLADLDEVALGRATAKRATRVARRLELGIPDARMSGVHARLVRDLTRWIVEDAGSKNGVAVNGIRRQRAVLDDGDIVELGHTLCLFRASGGRAACYPLDCERSDLAMPAPGLATFAPSIAAAFDDLALVARTDAAIVLLGETGTGKELVARAVHGLAGRTGAFVALNCGALPETLAESELFGYRKGAFSGANQDRLGLVRSADRGTLFLDEIGDLAPASQATLLRVLQEREVCPVGSSEPIAVDLHVVAATHHDLDALVAQGRFRRDLHARVAAFTLRLPPLRARPEDLGLLIADLLARSGHPAALRFTCEAGYALLRHGWPSNVRELAACLVVAGALARGGAVRVEHLPEAVRGAPPAATAEPSAEATGDDPKRAELVALLTEHGGNVSAVARAAHRSRVQVHRWLRRFGLDAARFRR
ncbi:MAG TPA: sigma 54-interacting transcriptional regulator [Kofleriaceae bacterium]|nr:sigma 54-interacting transcriptional regulator [Kofleriaceae bacterium]